MEEHRTTAGQGLGIAGLVLGILAIPVGIMPCTFYLGIVFGVVGIVLSIVALTQANRGYGPRNLIIAALVCSVIGLTFATVVGFALTRNGVRFVKEIIDDRGIVRDPLQEIGRDTRDMLNDMENDTANWSNPSSEDFKRLTDTLKKLEGESVHP
jgi:hypothetical protein